MPKDDLKPSRSWREIAETLTKETDHKTAMQLAEELIRALDRESMKRMDATAKTDAA